MSVKASSPSLRQLVPHIYQSRKKRLTVVQCRHAPSAYLVLMRLFRRQIGGCIANFTAVCEDFFLDKVAEDADPLRLA